MILRIAFCMLLILAYMHSADRAESKQKPYEKLGHFKSLIKSMPGHAATLFSALGENSYRISYLWVEPAAVIANEEFAERLSVAIHFNVLIPKRHQGPYGYCVTPVEQAVERFEVDRETLAIATFDILVFYGDYPSAACADIMRDRYHEGRLIY